MRIIDSASMAKHPEDHFVAEYERYSAMQANAKGTYLPLLRQKALQKFIAAGFPARKNESWKYTNMGPVVRRPYSIPNPDYVDAAGLPDLDAYVIVFVNGRLSPGQSKLQGLPAGVTVTSITDQAQAELVNAHLASYAHFASEAFTALNTAFVHDGAFIHVHPHTIVDKPIHIIHLVTAMNAALVQPRTLIVIEGGARAQVVQSTETHTEVPVLVNSVTEILVGEHGCFDHIVLQKGSSSASTVTNISAYQQQESKFYNGCFTFGGEIIRNNLSVLPDAEHCETFMHGLFIGRGSSHIDNHTLVDHAKPNCYSSEYYKGILNEKATGVFNGKVLVRQDAQQTNAYQTNRSIVLSKTARMYSKPALEIYADDVKCSHGATTGQLDKDGLFYLRARGINPDDAQRLMLISFAGDIIEKVPLVALQDVFYREVESMLR